jgi:transposase-like protein
MRKKIRDRTPQEQAIYEEIGDRILVERACDLSEEYGIGQATLRNWRRKARAKIQVNLSKLQDNLLIYSEAQNRDRKDVSIDVSRRSLVVSDSVSTRTDEKGDVLKSVFIDQALVPKACLEAKRGEIEGVFNDSHASISSIISRVKQLLGEDLSPVELKVLGATLKEQVKLFTDLHLLPFGSTKLAALKFSDTIPPQHLHLHSHGGRNQPKALNVIDADVIEAEPAAPASAELGAGQAKMVEEL